MSFPPPEELAVLRDMFDRDRRNAWEIAAYQRSQRDELTAKNRFAFAAINGASAVALLPILKGVPIAGLTTPQLLASLFIYVLGLALAGIALGIHEAHLTYISGQAFVRARSLDSCVTIMEAPIDKDSESGSRRFMESAHEAEMNMSAFENKWGIFLSYFSAGAWFAGTLQLLITSSIR